MHIIAITGGIGSGKTTVARWIGETGVPVVDADQISRSLTASGGAALPAIREAFGNGVFNADGTLDRAALAQIVFGGDAASRETLNAILHPMISKRMQQELDKLEQQGRPFVVIDVPLLYESGMDSVADTVICVTASEETRVQRIIKRSGLTRQQVLDRMRTQQDIKETEALADYVLSTDGTMQTNKRNTLNLWRQIIKKTEA